MNKSAQYNGATITVRPATVGDRLDAVELYNLYSEDIPSIKTREWRLVAPGGGHGARDRRGSAGL